MCTRDILVAFITLNVYDYEAQKENGILLFSRKAPSKLAVSHLPNYTIPSQQFSG
jgi:hypothetical protein